MVRGNTNHFCLKEFLMSSIIGLEIKQPYVPISQSHLLLLP